MGRSSGLSLDIGFEDSAAMGFIAGMDARAAHWWLPIRWFYLFVKWCLVILGAYLLVRLEELEIEGLLAFAEHVFTNLTALWTSAEHGDRRRLQDAVFPSGVVWDGANFGTAVTMPAFSWLQGMQTLEDGVASPICASWNQWRAWLRDVDGLRRSA